jgi:hypothetical protein
MLPVLRRIAQLCANLKADSTLRAELRNSGVSERDWMRLAEAMRRGELGNVIPMLDAVESAAAAAGIDGVTFPTRQYQPLPGSSPGFRTVSGWRCPHTLPCGRVGVGADRRTERWCALTGDRLAWASVASG